MKTKKLMCLPTCHSEVLCEHTEAWFLQLFHLVKVLPPLCMPDSGKDCAGLAEGGFVFPVLFASH